MPWRGAPAPPRRLTLLPARQRTGAAACRQGHGGRRSKGFRQDRQALHSPGYAWCLQAPPNQRGACIWLGRLASALLQFQAQRPPASKAPPFPQEPPAQKAPAIPLRWPVSSRTAVSPVSRDHGRPPVWRCRLGSGQRRGRSQARTYQLLVSTASRRPLLQLAAAAALTGLPPQGMRIRTGAAASAGGTALPR